MRKLVTTIVAGIVALLAGLMLTTPVTSHAAVTVSGLAAGDATVTDSAGSTVTSNSEFSKWENYEVSYNWSIPDDVSIANQSAAVALPNGLVAANDTTIPLTAEDGTVIGSFTIKAGETTGTLTFNEAGENARNRKGTLQFYVKGTTDTKPTDNNWKVNKVGWVGSKDPDGTPTALTWNVAFNAGSQNIGTVTVTDTLGPNQTFIPGSVTANTGSYDASGNFVSNGGKLTPTVSQSGQEITFTFANVTTAVDMTYQTKPNITGGSQTWTNTASSNGSSVTANIAYGGSGTGSGQGYGSVVLTKTGTDDVVLPGAEFELRDSTGKAVQTGLVTDANGQITLNRLVPGDYTLVETKAPAGYDLNTEAIPFTITEGATAVGQLHETDQATATTTPSEPGDGGSTVTPPTNPGTTNPSEPGEGGSGVTPPTNPGTTNPSEPGEGGTVTPPTNPGTTNPSEPGNGGSGVTPPTNPGTTNPSEPGEGGSGVTPPTNPGTTSPSEPGNGGSGVTPPTNPGTTNPSEPGNGGSGTTAPTTPGTTSPSESGNGGSGVTAPTTPSPTSPSEPETTSPAAPATGATPGQPGNAGSLTNGGMPAAGATTGAAAANAGTASAQGPTGSLGTTASGTLPQTNEQHSGWVAVVGLLALVGLGGYALYRKLRA